MKRLKKCEVENCIPTLSSCVEWNGGSIDYLGLCDGDSLNTILVEIITKLEDIAGDDLANFDIDSLLDICNQKAPTEVTLLSILNVVKANQVCLKDFVDGLSDKLNELLSEKEVNVNLKCYATFDNLGNGLTITRDSLDQLIIDNLCSQKLRLDGVEGKIVNIQSQIDNLNNNQTVDELNIATCIDPVVKPTSSQVLSNSTALCDLRLATGTPSDISAALANTPSDFATTDFIAIPNWVIAPGNQAQNYGNLLLAFNNLLQRVKHIEDTCCALSCKDVELGFSAIFNEDSDGLILRFTSGAGTEIPTGFEDQGSTGTVTDIDGNISQFNLVIANNYETEVSITGLNLLGDLQVDITAVLGTDGLTCQKCLHRVVKPSNQCGFCQYTAVGAEGSSVVLIYTAPSYSTTTTTTTLT